MPADWTIGILGPLRVAAGRTVVPVTAGRHRALLASLALGAGRVVSTDRLAADIWATELPDFPLRVIRSYVMRLRRLLAAAARR